MYDISLSFRVLLIERDPYRQLVNKCSYCTIYCGRIFCHPFLTRFVIHIFLIQKPILLQINTIIDWRQRFCTDILYWLPQRQYLLKRVKPPKPNDLVFYLFTNASAKLMLLSDKLYFLMKYQLPLAPITNGLLLHLLFPIYRSNIFNNLHLFFFEFIFVYRNQC